MNEAKKVVAFDPKKKSPWTERTANAEAEFFSLIREFLDILCERETCNSEKIYGIAVIHTAIHYEDKEIRFQIPYMIRKRFPSLMNAYVIQLKGGQPTQFYIRILQPLLPRRIIKK